MEDFREVKLFAVVRSILLRVFAATLLTVAVVSASVMVEMADLVMVASVGFDLENAVVGVVTAAMRLASVVEVYLDVSLTEKEVEVLVTVAAEIVLIVEGVEGEVVIEFAFVTEVVVCAVVIILKIIVVVVGIMGRDLFLAALMAVSLVIVFELVIFLVCTVV